MADDNKPRNLLVSLRRPDISTESSLPVSHHQIHRPLRGALGRILLLSRGLQAPATCQPILPARLCPSNTFEMSHRHGATL